MLCTTHLRISKRFEQNIHRELFSPVVIIFSCRRSISWRWIRDLVVKRLTYIVYSSLYQARAAVAAAWRSVSSRRSSSDTQRAFSSLVDKAFSSSVSNS
jgi:hypothetical protein